MPIVAAEPARRAPALILPGAHHFHSCSACLLRSRGSGYWIMATREGGFRADVLAT